MTSAKSAALRFVVTMGIVNLFADVTYEGGGSINGQFLGMLGASAAAIGIIAGAGEFLGYALRLVSGIVADRRGKLWPITFIGYSVNLLAVPAMALANHWVVAAALVFAERIGRALRKPTVEAMLSYSTESLGKGWAYALNTALDETGATLGPLVISLVLFLGGGYRIGYAVLLGSAVLAIAALVAARRAFPVPERLEQAKTTRPTKFGRAYWLYMAAGGCFAAGLLSFELMTFHLARSHLVTTSWIPALLALSTGLGVLASLALGKLFDRFGTLVVGVAVVVSAAFAPLALSNDRVLLIIAMLPWGIGYATQDTLFKAIVAGLLPEGKRNLAFGLFYAGYGVGWLVGSTTTGLLYDRSRSAVVVFCVAAQLTAIPLLALAARAKAKKA
jgi:MFS family permease